MDEHELMQQIRSEMQAAYAARAAGGEGRARVCARRAAGWSLLHKSTGSGEVKLGNAVELLKQLEADAGAGESIRAAARRLTTRLTPEHTLPFDEDPLLDAECVIHFAFGRRWQTFTGS